MSSVSGPELAAIIIASVSVFLVLVYLFLKWYTWRRATRVDPSVPRVAIDMNEYAGKWYEIASYPSWFEAGCKNVTATYKPEQGNIKVMNACYRNGRFEESIGTAYPTGHYGMLAVEFVPGIYGNYTVTYRDHDTSIVTNQDRSYLWILSRHPTMNAAKKAKLIQWLRTHDFNTEKLVYR